MASGTFWRRLEPRCRAENSNNGAWGEGLKARIHDPLWMLARQWQLGEFQGEDTGSAVVAELSTWSIFLDRYLLGPRNDPNRAGTSRSIADSSAPLEVLVEREKVVMNDLLRVRLGRFFERELDDDVLVELFRKAFPLKRLDPSEIDEGSDPERRGGEYASWRSASDQAIRFRVAIAGRVVDGGRLVEKLADGQTAAEAYEEAIAGLSDRPAQDAEIRDNGELSDDAHETMEQAGDRLYQWYRSLYSIPEEDQNLAWVDERLEYQFSVSARGDDGTEVVLDATEYYEGELDWYAFTIDMSPGATLGSRDADVPSKKSRFAVIPTPVEFQGMPDDRWWQFENRLVDLGNVDTAKTELGKLILTEFALVHSNDWFIIPVELTPGSLTEVTSLKVVDSFGLEHTIAPADDPENRWTLFALSESPRRASTPPFHSNLLFLPPSLSHLQESAPIEETLFLKDEMANMVWAVEKTLPDLLGRPKPGYELYLAGRRRVRELAREVAQKAISDWDAARVRRERLAAENASEAEIQTALSEELAALEQRNMAVNKYLAEGGDIRELEGLPPRQETGQELPMYKLFNVVPDNWIPFVPQPIPGELGQIMLRRYAMPDVRNVDPEDGRPGRIRARGRILKPEKRPFYIQEEEVPRVGVRVVRTVQFARGHTGRSFFWVGRRKRPGRGEGSSGLRFDYLQGRTPGMTESE